MGDLNKYGLSRWIDASTRREVRQRCGFGCVICGLSLYDYEHFDPDFKDARKHDPNGITLLCMQCNQKRFRKMLSVESVSAANKKPKCLQQGFANEAFDFGVEPIEVAFAGVAFTNCKCLIQVAGIPILSIADPEVIGGPYRLSGRFSDDCGQATLKIEENIWSVGADNWDVECNGPRIKINRGPRDVVLVLKSEPPTRLVVERINMEFEGMFFRGNQSVLEISRGKQNWSRWFGCNMANGVVGMNFS